MKHRRKRALAIGIFFLAGLVGVVAGLKRLGVMPGFRPEQTGAGPARRQAPGFELQDAAGKAYRLQDFKGKPVMIHFWATWCPPCIEELPKWFELASDFKSKGIVFIAISLDERWEDARKILPDQIEGALSLLDPKQKVPDRYGSYQYPETYLLDENHAIIEKFVGPQEWDNPKLRDYIIRSLARS